MGTSQALASMTDNHLSQTATNLLAATSGVTGDAFFAAMARTIAENLEVRWAFVGELIGPDKVRVIKGWDGGQPMPPFVYELRGTPCEQVVSQDACMIPCGVAQMFPEDKMLQDMGIESYFGIPVRSSDGKPIGLLAAMDEHPKRDSQDYLPLLELFAMRVGAEIERQRLEQQLMHGQKLESLGMLAGGIAHDFNNLLVGILGNIENAQAAAQRLAPAAQRPLDDARSAACAAAELTQQLLAYAGKQDSSPQALAIGKHLHETAKLVRRLLQGRAELELEIPDALPCVSGDPAQLRQVLLNLLTNANDALGDTPGKIRVATRLAPPNASEYGACNFRSDGFNACSAHVAIEVCDDGEGMDAASIERIFDPFWSSKSPGRGLGLAAVLGILRSHRGAIQVESEKGTGTTFRIYLPVTHERPPEPEEEEVVELPTQQRRILVIDDNDIVRSTLTRTLERLGCAVVSCDNGEHGVDAFREAERPFDGVIVDMVMPGMAGPEVLTRLRELDDDVRMVLTTGYNEDGQDLGPGLVEGVLHKPWTTDDIQRLVHETFAHA